MSSTRELITNTRHLLPNLDELEEQLAEEPEAIISRAFPPTGQASRPRALETTVLESEVLNQINSDDAQLRGRVVQAARRAISKIRVKGENALLEPDEALGYEAIVTLEGRPAIPIYYGGVFGTPPSAWEILNEARESIEKACRSAGRIEVSGHPDVDWVGTGFLVADDIVMTNRHVAKTFCQQSSSRWMFEMGMRACIDYGEEYFKSEREFPFEGVIGIHEKYDLALLRVSRDSSQGGTPPDSLILASSEPEPIQGRKVYVVGYPAWDPRRNDPWVMERIFGHRYDYKRLQPGELLTLSHTDSVLYHDCSTLGGNSGSCLIDLETHRVIGLHFGGRYLTANKAVPLWMLRDDPLLRALNYD